MMEPLRNAAKVSFAIIAIASLVGQSCARPQPDDMEDLKQALYATCSGKYPITEEMRASAKKGVFSDDRAFKCFMMCVFDELSLIDEKGEIDEDTMVAVVPESLKASVEKASKSCLPNIAGKPDSCEVSYNFLTCGIKFNPMIAEMLPV